MFGLNSTGASGAGRISIAAAPASDRRPAPLPVITQPPRAAGGQGWSVSSFNRSTRFSICLAARQIFVMGFAPDRRAFGAFHPVYLFFCSARRRCSSAASCSASATRAAEQGKRKNCSVLSRRIRCSWSPDRANSDHCDTSTKLPLQLRKNCSNHSSVGRSSGCWVRRAAADRAGGSARAPAAGRCAGRR